MLDTNIEKNVSETPKVEKPSMGFIQNGFSDYLKSNKKRFFKMLLKRKKRVNPFQTGKF